MIWGFVKTWQLGHFESGINQREFPRKPNYFTVIFLHVIPVIIINMEM